MVKTDTHTPHDHCNVPTCKGGVDPTSIEQRVLGTCIALVYPDKYMPHFWPTVKILNSPTVLQQTNWAVGDAPEQPVTALPVLESSPAAGNQTLQLGGPALYHLAP